MKTHAKQKIRSVIVFFKSASEIFAKCYITNLGLSLTENTLCNK